MRQVPVSEEGKVLWMKKGRSFPNSLIQVLLSRKLSWILNFNADGLSDPS